MDVFGEGHSNEVYTMNMISASLIKHLLIVYICVIRNFNKKRTLWMWTCDTCGCRLFFPLTIPPLFPPLVFLIIFCDKRCSGNFTLLYLRDGWMPEPCFWGRYSGNCLANGLNRRRVYWGNLEKAMQTYFSYTYSIFTSQKRSVQWESLEKHLTFQKVLQDHLNLQ